MVFPSRHMRKALSLAVLLIVFSAFTAEVLSVRKELRQLTCQGNAYDADIAVGIVSNATSFTVPTVIAGAVRCESSTRISFLYLLPYAFRGPPLSVQS